MKTLSERVAWNLFKFCGLTCVKNTPTGQVFLYRPFIFGIIAICSTCPISVAALILEMKSPNSKWMPTMTSISVTFIHYGSVMSSTVTIFTMAAWNYDKIGKMYSIIDAIEEKITVEKKYIKTQITFFASVTSTIMFFIWDYVICHKINNLYTWYSPIYFYEIIFIIFVFQLSTISNRIKELFRRLNADIANTLTSTAIKKLPKYLPDIETFLVPLAQMEPLMEDKSLQELCDFHWDICNAIGQFNDAFKSQLICHFLTIFIRLINSPYFFFVAARDKVINSDNIQYLITCFLWTALHAAQLLGIVLPCGAAAKVGNETSFILSKNLHYDAPIHVKKNVRSFLHLLNVHRTDFHCGIFTLNESVISAVTGSVTTYLVILIQFQIEEFQS